MSYLWIVAFNILLIASLIGISSYVFLKMFKWQHGYGICFALGYSLFFAASLIRIRFFPSYQEWGPLFIILVSMPASLISVYLNEAISRENSFPIWLISFVRGYGMLFLVGTIQYYLIGCAISSILNFIKIRKVKI